MYQQTSEANARVGKAKQFIPQRWADPLPFLYESTGIETKFVDQRDPEARSRPVFGFHTPEHQLILCTNGGTNNKKKEQQGDIRKAKSIKARYEAAKLDKNAQFHLKKLDYES